MELQKIIDRIDAVLIPRDATITQLKHEEDDELYGVWKIDAGQTGYILKEAKEKEYALYSTVFSIAKESVPALLQVITAGEKTYLLMEYIEGEDLCRCDRAKLTCALNALIELQKSTWNMDEAGHLIDSFDHSLQSRENRGKYLKDVQLEQAYEAFLRRYRTAPKTLCHDDLLPFNILVGKEKACLIDWECGGILPYPTAFARLIAHAEEKDDALFYMTREDQQFAIDYYYENLLKEKGISYRQWRQELEYFLFYEYCEWVFVGNKYNATDGEYYQKYLPIAKQQAAKLLEKSNSD